MTKRPDPGTRPAPQAQRRNLIGGFVLVGVFALMIYFGQGFMVRIGMYPQPTVYRAGTAVITDCGPALRWGGWVQLCTADVTWSPRSTWRTGLTLALESRTTVVSDAALTGTVPVESHRMPRLGIRGGGTSSAGEMVIAAGSKRIGAPGWWVIPLAVVPFGAAIGVNAAFHAGWNAVVRRRVR